MQNQIYSGFFLSHIRSRWNTECPLCWVKCRVSKSHNRCPPTNSVASVCRIKRCLRRWGSQWSLTVVTCPFHSTRQCHTNGNISPIFLPPAVGNNSGAKVTNTTAGLNSSLVLHYTGWQGVFVLFWVQSPRLHSEAAGTREWWAKAGRVRNSNGKRKEQGLPVSIDQSLYAHVCPTLLRSGYMGVTQSSTDRWSLPSSVMILRLALECLK